MSSSDPLQVDKSSELSSASSLINILKGYVFWKIVTTWEHRRQLLLKAEACPISSSHIRLSNFDWQFLLTLLFMINSNSFKKILSLGRRVVGKISIKFHRTGFYVFFYVSTLLPSELEYWSGGAIRFFRGFGGNSGLIRELTFGLIRKSHPKKFQSRSLTSSGLIWALNAWLHHWKWRFCEVKQSDECLPKRHPISTWHAGTFHHLSRWSGEELSRRLQSNYRCCFKNGNYYEKREPPTVPSYMRTSDGPGLIPRETSVNDQLASLLENIFATASFETDDDNRKISTVVFLRSWSGMMVSLREWQHVKMENFYSPFPQVVKCLKGKWKVLSLPERYHHST